MTDCVKRDYDNTVLVLQGGGALGAYQAGVYEGLAEAGYAPDWVTGVSIGAINAALIAGNPPELRVERLREFWNLVSSGLLGNAPRGHEACTAPSTAPARRSARRWGFRVSTGRACRPLR